MFNVVLALNLSDRDDIQILYQHFPSGLNIAGFAPNRFFLEETIRREKVDAVILSPSFDGYSAELISSLFNHPERPIIIVGCIPRGRDDLRREMEDAGACGFIHSPLTVEEVQKLSALIPEKIVEAERRRKSPGYIPFIPSSIAALYEKHGWKKSVVAVWGASGGVGKTTISVNLGAILATAGGRRVIVVDGDMNKADAHLCLDVLMGNLNVYSLAARYSIEKSRYDGVLTTKLLEDYTCEVKFRGSPNSMRFLPGIPQPWMSGTRELGEEGNIFAEALVKAMREGFDFGIVDLGQSLVNPFHWAILRTCDLVLAVTTPARTAINALKKALEALLTQVPREKVYAVVNQFHPDQGVSQADIQKVLGVPVLLAIPRAEEERGIRSINEGVPLVISYPQDPASKGIIALATFLFPPLREIIEMRDRKKGLFTRFLEELRI